MKRWKRGNKGGEGKQGVKKEGDQESGSDSVKGDGLASGDAEVLEFLLNHHGAEGLLLPGGGEDKGTRDDVAEGSHKVVHGHDDGNHQETRSHEDGREDHLHTPITTKVAGIASIVVGASSVASGASVSVAIAVSVSVSTSVATSIAGATVAGAAQKDAKAGEVVAFADVEETVFRDAGGFASPESPILVHR